MLNKERALECLYNSGLKKYFSLTELDRIASFLTFHYHFNLSVEGPPPPDVTPEQLTPTNTYVRVKEKHSYPDTDFYRNVTNEFPPALQERIHSDRTRVVRPSEYPTVCASKKKIWG